MGNITHGGDLVFVVLNGLVKLAIHLKIIKNFIKESHWLMLSSSYEFVLVCLTRLGKSNLKMILL